MNFEFSTASRIVFGSGKVKDIAQYASRYGERLLLVTGAPSEIVEQVQGYLKQGGLNCTTVHVNCEPSTESIQSAVQISRENNIEMVISIGGGSAIDTGKAVAVLLNNVGELYEYLEVVGLGKPLRNPGLPFIAIPTTAGTGSEVTSNAVMSAEAGEEIKKKVKVSLRSPFMFPKLALVDPQLTVDLPPSVTAFTGLDALTQLIEPFVSKRANPFTDILCREGICLAGRSLRVVYHQGANLEAREEMSLASLLGGMALANAKLGAVHGFAAPIGGKYSASHGAICARLLPIVTEVNVRALRERKADHPVLGRYEEIARILTGNPVAKIEDGVDWLTEICDELEIPDLSIFGVNLQDIPELVEQARQASSMQGNPLQLTDEELSEILSQAL